MSGSGEMTAGGVAAQIWADLTALAPQRLEALFARDPARVEAMTRRIAWPIGLGDDATAGMRIDFSKTHLGEAELAAFEALAEAMGFGPAREALFGAPRHPYTEALLSAVPEPDPSLEARTSRIILKGDVPSPSNPPKGCNFCTRCPKVMDICKTIEPNYQEIESGHFVACHLYEKN